MKVRAKATKKGVVQHELSLNNEDVVELLRSALDLPEGVSIVLTPQVRDDVFSLGSAREIEIAAVWETRSLDEDDVTISVAEEATRRKVR